MTHPTLYLSSKDNKLHVFDMPDSKQFIDNTSEDGNEYFDEESCRDAEQKAIANKVLVKDQTHAIDILFRQYKIIADTFVNINGKSVKKDTPYPISGYSVTIERIPKYGVDWLDHRVIVGFYEVAILTPVKEESKYLKDFKRTSKIIEKFWNRKVENADNATAFKEEIHNHEIALQLFRAFLKENADYISMGGEPSFAVFLAIRLKKLANGDKTWNSIPVVKAVDELTEGNGEWISVKIEPNIGKKYLFLTDEIMFPDNAFTGVYYGNNEWRKSETIDIIKNVVYYQELPDTSKLSNS